MKEAHKKQFYKELGRLLYGIAACDGAISQQEVDALNEMVSKIFASTENSYDSSGMNQAFYTGFEFEKCAEEQMKVEEAGRSFLAFIDNHLMHLEPWMIEKSIEAVEKVAAAYQNVNREESAFIEKTKAALGQILDVF